MLEDHLKKELIAKLNEAIGAEHGFVLTLSYKMKEKGPDDLNHYRIVSMGFPHAEVVPCLKHHEREFLGQHMGVPTLTEEDITSWR